MQKNEVVVFMDEKKRLRKLGNIIHEARRRYKISQGQLGAMIWPDLTQTACQSRIHRLENGMMDCNDRLIHRIFEILNIVDIDVQTLESKFDSMFNEKLLIHPKVVNLIPEVKPFIELINLAAKRDQIKKVISLFHQMCDEISYNHPLDDDLKSVEGDIDPF
jgi:hypothetical protein